MMLGSWLGSDSGRRVVLVLGAVAAAPTAWSGEIPIGHILTEVDPARHDVVGGSRIRIYGDGRGSGFQPAFCVKLNGADATHLRVLSPRAMTGLVPTHPLGTSGLELRSRGGELFFVLPQAVEYIIREIPPPEDDSVTWLAITRIELSWSDPTLNDQIVVRRHGVTLAILAGDAAAYIDTFTSPPT